MIRMNTLYYATDNSGDSLMHYGVLGMRWGIRHDKDVKAAKREFKTEQKQINKTKGLSKGERKERIGQAREKWMQSREKAANKLYSRQDKATNKAVARMSSGKTILHSMLLGSYGALTYRQARSAGNSKGKAVVKGILAEYGNQYTFSALSNSEYMRNRLARKGNTNNVFEKIGQDQDKLKRI